MISSLDVTRFRRVEMVLIDLLGSAAAETVCSVIALCAERPVPDPCVLDEVTIALSDAALGLGLDREDTFERLRRADALLGNAIGIQMLAGAAYDVFEPHPRLTLDADFVDVVRGVSVSTQPLLPLRRPRPDIDSETWLSVLARTAASDAPMPFFYRCAQDQADRADEMLGVAAALAQVGVEAGIVVLNARNADRRLPLAAQSISAMLVLSARIIVISDDPVAVPRKRDESDDNVLDVGEEASNHADRSHPYRLRASACWQSRR